MPLRTGARLGPYEILSPLGAGGMGEVYRARDTRLGREVAIKVLPEMLAGDSELAARFEREARAVAALSHPNILTLFDVGVEAGRSYAVMELLEGETLRVRLAAGSLPWRKAIEIAIAVAEGLAAAHRQGIVHRDLKPENVFLTSDGLVKILDFGLARRRGAPEKVGETSTPTEGAATEPGVVMGTAGYMSPEQVRGQAAEAQSDVFAFGCVLYEMITGRRAFTGSTAAEALAATLRDEPPDPAEAGRDVPVSLSAIVRHCLEKRPEERFQSARDLAFDLRAVLAGAAATAVSSGVRRPAIESIAVLPFTNQSGDPDAEYLSDGIADSILQSLSRLPNLRVMARSSLSRYKGKEAHPQDVGRELGVQALLTGRVYHRGEALVVKTDLVDTRSGSLIWAESYNRRFSDILAIEEEIAKEISEKLRLKVTGQEALRLTRRSTESIDAHRLYLRGRFFLEKRAGDSLRKAIEHFQQAIDEDPEYSLAYAGLAECYNFLGYYGHRAPAESFPKAKAAATRALGLDRALSEARAARGVARSYYDWDWAGAEEDFRLVIAASPTYANARQFYANFLAARGRFEEAFAEVSRAEELDPLSLPVKTAAGWCRYLARRFEESIAGLEAAIEMDPSFVPVHHVLALDDIHRNRHERAVDEAGRAAALSGRGTTFVATLGLAYASSGRGSEAVEVLRELDETARQHYVSAYQLAAVDGVLGDRNRAFDRLESALRQRDWNLILLRVDPRVDPLRSDPRFAELLHRVGE